MRWGWGGMVLDMFMCTEDFLYDKEVAEFWDLKKGVELEVELPSNRSSPSFVSRA